MNTLNAPAQLFLSHYFLLDSYIQKRNDLDSLPSAPAFEEVKRRSDVDLGVLEKILLNSWSAEYALRITPTVNDEEYLQSSLHWTFPQAYYSVLFSARALLLVEGVRASNEDVVRKEISRRVVKGYYPQSLGFGAFGYPYFYKFIRMHPRVTLTAELESLNIFLTSTRDLQIKKAHQNVQTDPHKAFRDANSGAILQRLSSEEYAELGKRLGASTYYDLISRLRISSTNREVERFVGADIDVGAFHTSLTNIVSHINAIHELYVAKAIGLYDYQKLVNRLPLYLRDGFVGDRLVKNHLTVK